MHLLRVQVPDFRGLKNIDITFEKDFVPSIFPLGSQNGGGKSTLLQLIFVLLHCSVDEEKKPFLENLLQGFKIYDGEDTRVLAIIDIWDGEKVVKIGFNSYKSHLSLRQILLTVTSDNKVIHETLVGADPDLDLSTHLRHLEIVKNATKKFEFQKNRLAEILNRLHEIMEWEENNEEIRLDVIKGAIRSIQLELIGGFPELESVMRPSNITCIEDVKKIQQEIGEILSSAEMNFRSSYKQSKALEDIWEKSIKVLQSQNMRYICNYSIERQSNNKRDETLLCHVNNIDCTETEEFLTKLSYNTNLI